MNVVQGRFSRLHKPNINFGDSKVGDDLGLALVFAWYSTKEFAKSLKPLLIMVMIFVGFVLITELTVDYPRFRLPFFWGLFYGLGYTAWSFALGGFVAVQNASPKEVSVTYGSTTATKKGLSLLFVAVAVGSVALLALLVFKLNPLVIMLLIVLQLLGLIFKNLQSPGRFASGLLAFVAMIAMTLVYVLSGQA